MTAFTIPVDPQTEAELILRELNRSRRKVSLSLAFECVDYLDRAGGLRTSPKRVKDRIVAVSYRKARELKPSAGNSRREEPGGAEGGG